MLQTLDSSQSKFCEAPDGNIRLLAPAGCGKTISLLFRCAYLAEKAKPQRLRFLIVTFTVVAKQELLSRLNEDEKFAVLRDRVEIEQPSRLLVMMIKLFLNGVGRLQNIS